ncbi:hypothetical protein Godav_027732 [Gossypium davidsonii]|uniref:Uncharacterized protein n=1 Tax=Gossypium davidsonii TaxID=34287 RepID=A0A7J8RYG9_GOSDV|nr:hypothetical protein [Gossypium davidsonii]
MHSPYSAGLQPNGRLVACNVITALIGFAPITSIARNSHYAPSAPIRIPPAFHIFYSIFCPHQASDSPTFPFLFPSIGSAIGSFGKRRNKTHTLCVRCGCRSFHLQKSRCSACVFSAARKMTCKCLVYFFFVIQIVYCVFRFCC